MRFTLDPINITNLALCLIILILGYGSYKRDKNELAALIATAFGMFAISHVLTLQGLETLLQATIITIRLFAYALVAFGIYRITRKR